MARSANTRGFTLIELMIVVAIIAVLATIAGTAYRRYMDSGRTAEAMSMLGEIRSKEEAYRAEFNAYAGWSLNSEAVGNTLPAVDTQVCATGGSKEPCNKAIAPSGWVGQWVVWQGLGIVTPRAQLYCGYTLNSDKQGNPAAGSLGAGILGSSTPTAPFWYAVAQCDNDGTIGTNATFTTASITTVVSVQNEHK
ncbi:MAG TPA: prepilin-type N-terminal cleavage/methylation domain-containing protein [Polyangia bacterium]